MGDGSAPFWGAFITVILFVVAFGRDMAARFYKSVDEQKAENATLKQRLDALEESDKQNASKIAGLESDLEEERARTRRERAAKEAFEKEAATANAEAETLRQTKTRLDKRVEELTQVQLNLATRVESLENDAKKRDQDHTSALQAEVTRREKAERERDTYKEENDYLRQEINAMRESLKALTEEVQLLKQATNGNGHTETPSQ